MHSNCRIPMKSGAVSKQRQLQDAVLNKCPTTFCHFPAAARSLVHSSSAPQQSCSHTMVYWNLLDLIFLLSSTRIWWPETFFSGVLLWNDVVLASSMFTLCCNSTRVSGGRWMVFALEQPGQMLLQPPMFAARVFVGPAAEIHWQRHVYVWADKIGTVFTSNAQALTEGNDLPCWTHSQKRYQVLPETFWKQRKISIDVYEKLLFLTRDGVLSRHRKPGSLP